MKVLVAGAGGLIRGNLVLRLLSNGHCVKAIDIKPLQDWYHCHDNTGTNDWIEAEIAKNRQP
jgi:nucleoside-diphosphate-sugar epimerase